MKALLIAIVLTLCACSRPMTGEEIIAAQAHCRALGLDYKYVEQMRLIENDRLIAIDCR